MDAWIIGLIAVCVLGVAVILYGALSDRAKHRREVAELISAPSRPIPLFHPDAPAPTYLSDLQARRADPSVTTGLSVRDRDDLRSQIGTDAAASVPVGYASADFVTDPDSGWAVLEDPWVLTCAEPITALRELLGLLEKVIMGDRSIVLVAPQVAPDVLGTLEVNRIQHKLRCVVVISKDPKPVDRIGKLTGATLVGRADLQAGYLTAAMLGRCRRWVSSADQSYVLAGRPPGSPRVDEE